MRPRALHGGMHAESPEVTGDFFCHRCGNVAVFVGYDDRGMPAECDEGCTGVGETCACSITLRQVFHVEPSGTIEYDEFTVSGGGDVTGAAIGSYTRVQCGVCRRYLWCEPEFLALARPFHA